MAGGCLAQGETAVQHMLGAPALGACQLAPAACNCTRWRCSPALPAALRAANHIVTASHDATAKLWDLRAAVPLHTLEGAEDKLLCAAWVGPGTVATGGADCKLRTAAVEVAQ